MGCIVSMFLFDSHSVIRLKSSEKEKNGKFVVHTIQLKPRLACKTLEVNKMISVTSQSETVQPFAVQVL